MNSNRFTKAIIFCLFFISLSAAKSTPFVDSLNSMYKDIPKLTDYGYSEIKCDMFIPNLMEKYNFYKILNLDTSKFIWKVVVNEKNPKLIPGEKLPKPLVLNFSDKFFDGFQLTHSLLLEEAFHLFSNEENCWMPEHYYNPKNYLEQKGDTVYSHFFMENGDEVIQTGLKDLSYFSFIIEGVSIQSFMKNIKGRLYSDSIEIKLPQKDVNAKFHYIKDNVGFRHIESIEIWVKFKEHGTTKIHDTVEFQNCELK